MITASEEFIIVKITAELLSRLKKTNHQVVIQMSKHGADIIIEGRTAIRLS